MISKRCVGAVQVIEMSIPFNDEVTASFKEVSAECLKASSGQVIVDLDRVPVIDSKGLENLLDLQDACLRRGGALKLAAPGPICGDALRITGVDQMIEVFPSVLAATGSFSE